MKVSKITFPNTVERNAMKITQEMKQGAVVGDIGQYKAFQNRIWILQDDKN